MDYKTLSTKSLYLDEVEQINNIIKALNGVKALANLDGVVKHYSENADLLASFWYDSEAEAWRVYVGVDDIEGYPRNV